VKYLALIYADETAWESFSDEERAAGYAQYTAFAEEAEKAGVIAGGDELAATRTATTVRVRDGETQVTDGPYAETKEALGGYFLLECSSMDEALEWAAKIPAVHYGAVEVRQVHDQDQEDAGAAPTAAEREGVAS
jgi:hypothetical protein